MQEEGHPLHATEDQITEHMRLIIEFRDSEKACVLFEWRGEGRASLRSREREREGDRRES